MFHVISRRSFSVGSLFGYLEVSWLVVDDFDVTDIDDLNTAGRVEYFLTPLSLSFVGSDLECLLDGVREEWLILSLKLLACT